MRYALPGVLIALWALLWQAVDVRAAATLLPNGQQCFAATSPTSGGLYGPIVTLGTITPGSGYVSATYTNVPLTGGSGFGAQATITVTGGAVASVTVTNPGSHYTGADTLSASAALLGGSGAGFSVPVATVSSTGTGMVGLLGAITGGSGGTTGTYPGVALTGGSGSSATATITVSGGAVTSVTILNPGTGYQVADTLTAASGNIGGTTGFSVPVSSVAINNSLAGGSVGFFIPNTNSLKQTWTNSTQTVLNTNPVILDQNGCATIYGTGSYRQVLQDAMGNTVWDTVTTDTSAQQNVFWAGNATGTPNAISLTDAGFNGTDGSIVNFFPIGTNTGAATISIAGSAFTNIAVVKDTTGGPVALTGGEIVQAGTPNVVSVLYSAVQNNFHLLNTAIASASGANTPFCGAIGLKITNTNSSTISLTAGQIVMQAANGFVINRSSVSLTGINISTGTATSTANGMDGEAPGTSAWLYVWAIDNGAAPAGLVSAASGSGLAPILPSGYSYKCRLGAMRVDGSGNLISTLQYGSEAQYVIAASGALPVITSSYSTFWTASAVGAFVPPTATRIKAASEMAIAIANNGVGTGTNTGSFGVAPNSNYAQPVNAGRPPCSWSWGGTFGSGRGDTITDTSAIICDLLLESGNIYTGSASAAGSGATVTLTGTLSALGWKDNVNAN